MELRYAAKFWKDEDGVVCVDFPELGGAGQGTHGDSWEDARAMAQDLVDGYLTVCLEDNEDPMEPDAALPKGEGWEWVYPSQRVSVAWQIRTLRKAKGMSQRQVAEALGVAQETYVRWENPRRFNARLDTLEKLAKVFGRRLTVSLGGIAN